MKAFQSVILVTAAVFFTLAQTSFNLESGDAAAQSLKSKAQPTIDYAARAQAQRAKVDELQAQNPQMSKTDVSRACAMSDFQAGMNNHDPHALDWAFIPGKSGIPIAQDPQLSLQLTTMRQELQANYENSLKFAAWQAENNQMEANRRLNTQLMQLRINPDLDPIQKSIEMKKILKDSAGKVDPASMQDYWEMAEQFGKGFASSDDGAAVFALRSDIALGKVSPETIVKRTEELKSQGKLTEETFNYLLRQAYNIEQCYNARSSWKPGDDIPEYPPPVDFQVEDTELHCKKNPLEGSKDCNVSFLIIGQSVSLGRFDKSYSCEASLGYRQEHSFVESNVSRGVDGDLCMGKGHGSRYEMVTVKVGEESNIGGPVTEVRLGHVQCR
ncbi:MAG: hypothetical protein ABSF90_05080 [Syntrophobacteraceae bacterium]|jgi:hypothetical protein